MNEFIKKHNFLKTFLILFLCLSLVSSITLYSSMKAHASEISEKVQKDRPVPLIIGLLAANIAFGAVTGAAISGCWYAVTNIWNGSWTIVGQRTSIISGLASGAIGGLIGGIGGGAVVTAYAMSAPAVEQEFFEFFKPLVESVTDAEPKTFKSIYAILENMLNSIRPEIESFIQEQIDFITGNPGQQFGEVGVYEVFWADFYNQTITTSSMAVNTIGMEYNDVYDESWRMPYPGFSKLNCNFSITEISEEIVLDIMHLTSASSNVPSGGYAPIDIYINGTFFLDNYDVAESHSDSHAYEYDIWDITSYLQIGENSIEILYDSSAETHYWIQNLIIRPLSFVTDFSSSVFLISPTGSDPSTTVESTWSVSGNITDGNGNNVVGANVNVFLSGYSQSWGSDTTDSNGNYSISNISAPAAESYTITIEVTSGGATGSNSSQTLTVTDPKVGHDLSIEGFSVDPYSVTPGGAFDLIVQRITNNGDYPEEFDLIFELKYPNGSLCASKSKHLTLNEGISLTNQSETLFSDSSVSGNYTAIVRIDCPYDFNPEDNKSSLSVYVGQMQDHAQYKGDYLDCFPEDPVMVYGDYQLNVYSMMTNYFWANVLKNGTPIVNGVRFDRYVPHYFGDLLVFCEMSEIHYCSAYMGTTAPVPFTYNPSTPHFPQGTTRDLTVTSNTGEDIRSFGDGDIILTDDVSYVRNWYIGENGQYDYMIRHFKIPVDQSVGTYTVWFDDSIEQQQYHYLKKIDFVIEKGHDAFINSISTKVDGVEKTEFDIGEDVTITANVGVSGGYTEEVNVVLSITGPNDYYYPDSKDRIESKATISSTSQDIAFDPWNTSGLMPGAYTISVTANMGADINSGNNTKTKAVVIKELPALIVNGQTDKTTYDQGEQIELTATVTDPNTNPVNDATVTATITWPDLTESNPALSYNASSGKYEYNFNAPQFGSYTIELRAIKTNYGTGTKELPIVTVNNTPPNTTINNVVPSEGQTINSNSVIFSWTGSDSGTPVHHLAYSWKLDEGSYSAFSTSTMIELTDLVDGTHTFYVKAYDGQLEDPTPSQRSFVVDTSEPPEVYLSKTANKTTVTSGEVVTYTITYDNDGAGPAKNTVIEDVIPANTTYVAASASSGNAIHTGNVVVEIEVNSVWEPDSASPSGEVIAVRWTFDSDIAVDDGDNHGSAEDEAPNTNDTDAGTVTLQVTID